ncbi:type II toxin-antitoxin system HicB family antitoxin [Brevundimonas sp. 2R-24]|uniref:Type II toxin-antitoxin system HicB family antitoxin n=1 Tax=Peiella sedimenti TaxID=3061083 RepID=A0ABT8SRF5_9CAUL|nr:type II toxin-antitoxin system HicB family antitoxin [Caulobacteraceae bacterium XZ-24]
MDKVYYVAVLEPASGSEWGVYFPDLPGCTSGGDSMEDAVREAGEALALHLSGMKEDGLEAPKPRGLHDFGPEDVHGDPEAVVLVAVPANAPTEPERAERINLTMNPRLLARIDAYTNAVGISRSAFLAMAARQALVRERAP